MLTNAEHLGAQVQWKASGHTWWCEWKDLRFPSVEAEREAQKKRSVGLLAVGDRVLRGPNWNSGDDDGGPGSVGEASGCMRKDMQREFVYRETG